MPTLRETLSSGSRGFHARNFIRPGTRPWTAPVALAVTQGRRGGGGGRTGNKDSKERGERSVAQHL